MGFLTILCSFALFVSIGPEKPRWGSGQVMYVCICMYVWFLTLLFCRGRLKIETIFITRMHCALAFSSLSVSGDVRRKAPPHSPRAWNTLTVPLRARCRYGYTASWVDMFVTDSLKWKGRHRTSEVEISECCRLTVIDICGPVPVVSHHSAFLVNFAERFWHSLLTWREKQMPVW